VHLTDKQQRFIDEYLIHLNGRQAAIRARYSAKTAAVAASKLLRNRWVAHGLAVARKQLAERTGVSQERIVRELAKVAFADIAELVDEHGRLKRLSEVGEVSAAVAAMRVSRTVGAEGRRSVQQYAIRIHDKLGALALLLRHLTPTVQDGKDLTMAADAGLLERLGEADLRRVAAAIAEVRGILQKAAEQQRRARIIRANAARRAGS
jgi:phage terminase small subunit